MADSRHPSSFKEILPKNGYLYSVDDTPMILCKPKLMPLKSVTLEKLEKMQKDAQDTMKAQEEMERHERSLISKENSI
eukprot:m.310737 g.310737  ORF g.310737 m.310737 type:complete len:78 (+) comp54278_c0_seq1:16-249(+)